MSARSRWLELVLVLGFCLFLFAYGIGSFGLTGADEPRYAQVAREMLARGDWVTPVLYGQPWLEKPILYYWQAMAAYSLFGVSDAAARLPSVVLATLMVLAVYFFCRRLRPGSELDAALITASGAMVLGMARGASTDMSLAAPFAVAMLAWYAWHESGRRWLLAAFYVCLGLAMLGKGPVAPALAACIVGAFCLLVREPRTLAKTLWLPGILLFLAVALPWYVAVELRNPQFVRVFILEHNLARFGSAMFRHKQPFWYYLPVLLLATAPWTVPVVRGVVNAFAQRRRPAEARDSLQLFLAIWAILPVVVFSISQSKLPAYVLPSVPAFLLLGALYVREELSGKRPPQLWFVLAQAAVCGLVLAGALVAPELMLRVRPTARVWIAVAAAGSLLFLATAVVLRRRGWAMLRPLTLVPVVLALAFLIKVASPAIDRSQSARPLAGFLRELGVGASDHLAFFQARRDIAYGLAFYRNRPPEVYEGWPTLDPVEAAPSGVPPSGRFYVLTGERTNVSDPEAQLRQRLPGRELRTIGYYRPHRLRVMSVEAASTAPETPHAP